MKSMLLAVVGIACIVAPWAFGSPVRDLRDWRSSGSWEAVPAKVTSVSSIQTNAEGKPQVDVQYEYEYAGQKHASAYRMENVRRSEIPDKGKALTIKVNPANPAQALFDPGRHLLERAIGSFVLMAIGAWILWKVLSGKADDIQIGSDTDRDA